MSKELNEVKIIDTYEEMNWGLKAINADKVWSITEGDGVKIAVMDTGVDVYHPDLQHAIKATINMHTKTLDVTDEYGHGTSVAGLLAGKNTGVAPKSELYISKVLDKNGFGTMANILDGITLAINYKVDILCMSLGIPAKLPLILEERISQAYDAGVTIVCATGNSNKGVEYPAFYDNVIAVGGVNKDLSRAEFSNHGRQMDVVAPAVGILSTYIDGKYSLMSGTSMASPLVAGSIALLKSYYRKKNIELSPSDIKDMLSCLGENKSEEYGYGVMDLTKLIK